MKSDLRSDGGGGAHYISAMDTPAILIEKNRKLFLRGTPRPPLQCAGRQTRGRVFSPERFTPDLMPGDIIGSEILQER